MSHPPNGGEPSNPDLAAKPPGPTNIEEFPVARIAGSDPDEDDEYLVDVETRQTILVMHATSPEDAIVKAVGGNFDGNDLDCEVVAHDVHVCIHTGIEAEECEEHEETE